MDDELRELFLRRAEDVPPHRHVPPTLAGRARRRIVRNVLGAGAVVAALGVGGLAGVRALTGAAAPHVVTSQPPPTSPSTGQSTGAGGPCAPVDLRATASLQGAAGSREGAIVITNVSTGTCTLEGTPTLTMLDHDLTPITTGITFDPSDPQWKVDGSPEPAGWPLVSVRPGASASLRIRWSNWCLDAGATPAWRITVSGGAVDVDGLGQDSVPPCNGPGQPSTIEVGPFEPNPS